MEECVLTRALETVDVNRAATSNGDGSVLHVARQVTVLGGLVVRRHRKTFALGNVCIDWKLDPSEVDDQSIRAWGTAATGIALLSIVSIEQSIRDRFGLGMLLDVLFHGHPVGFHQVVSEVKVLMPTDGANYLRLVSLLGFCFALCHFVVLLTFSPFRLETQRLLVSFHPVYPQPLESNRVTQYLLGRSILPYCSTKQSLYSQILLLILKVSEGSPRSHMRWHLESVGGQPRNLNRIIHSTSPSSSYPVYPQVSESNKLSEKSFIEMCPTRARTYKYVKTKKL